MANKTLRQLGKLTLSVLISAPLTYGSFVALNESLGERFSGLLLMAGCSLFWSSVAAVGLELLDRRPHQKFLLDCVGLAFLTACVNFIVFVSAAVIWVMFFFVS